MNGFSTHVEKKTKKKNKNKEEKEKKNQRCVMKSSDVILEKIEHIQELFVKNIIMYSKICYSYKRKEIRE